MSIISGLIKRIKDPYIAYNELLQQTAGLWSDELFICMMFRIRTKRRLNLNNPETFNEKLQWLKLYDRKEIYTTMVDKYAVKDYVAKLIGDEYIIPTIGVWDNPYEIDFDSLPNQFVLKCTHDSGSAIICKDKARLDKDAVRKKLSKSLKRNYYYHSREWPYKDIPRRIIAETYLKDENGDELKDYKVFCFNGSPQIIEVDIDRFSYHKRNIYSTEWRRLDLEIKYPSDSMHDVPCPDNLDEMLSIASLLSEGIPYLRVDLYNVHGKTYFGEMTFFHGSGIERIEPEEWNYKLGEMIILPNLEISSIRKTIERCRF